MKDIAIKVKNLSKCYKVYGRSRDRLKQMLWGSRKRFYKEFWALKNISFEIKKGSAFGIIGRNGSGKSTLLQLICRTLTPTTGEIEVNGRVAALLELGAGFNPEFTGRENVYLNGAILGFSRQEITDRFDKIAAFADIGDFMEQPVKNYSSGMFVRLAFAVQACVEPDVLIVDEALSVGDIFFQMKCYARMEELIRQGTAIIFVTHDMAAIEKYCDSVLLLNKGKNIFLGQPNEAVERYYQLDGSFTDQTAQIKHGQDNMDMPAVSQIRKMVDPKIGFSEFDGANRHILDWPVGMFLDLSNAITLGDESIAKCLNVALCDSSGKPKIVFEMGETAYFYYEYELLQDIQVPIGGIVITDKMNVNVHGKSSLQYLQQAPTFVKSGSRIRFRQAIELSIAPGEYVFQVGLSTIAPEDYASVTKLEHIQLDVKMKTILRVRQCGRIVVTQKHEDLRLPFYGYADLKGDICLSVLSGESEES